MKCMKLKDLLKVMNSMDYVRIYDESITPDSPGSSKCIYYGTIRDMGKEFLAEFSNRQIVSISIGMCYELGIKVI